jgi:rhamnogalacturonyl hydrolase YesR
MLHDKKWIHYAEVCTWYGALQFAEVANDTVLQRKLKERFLPFFSAKHNLLPIMNHVDLNMFGCLPLELYKLTQEKKYLDLGLPYADSQWILPENYTVNELELSTKGLSWQTRFWIDDMFMINILQSQAYLTTHNRKYIDRAAREMVIYLNRLQLPNGLFYHAPDVPFCWGRGNGWMSAGMTEILRNLPKNHPDRKRIMNGYLKMMNRLLKCQTKNGLWNQLVDDPACWEETSGSAMFTYAIITGVKRGWLDKNTFLPVVKKAWLSLVSHINSDGDLMDICIGTDKLNDKEYYYNRPRKAGDFHGQAPVLWCAYAMLED